uniref:Uncharacterized protein n=1 Tax=Chenopodium quinoa TaxID=63459 RepID=A0A803MM33_CHEQI
MIVGIQCVGITVCVYYCVEQPANVICRMHAFIKVNDGLDPTRKNAVQEMGLGSLLNLKVNRLDKKFCYWLHTRVDHVSSVMQFGDGVELPLCPMQWNCVLGIRFGYTEKDRHLTWAGRRCDNLSFSLVSAVAIAHERKFGKYGFVTGCGGCTLFLQLFYVDNLSLTPYSWGEMPRINVWTQERVSGVIKEEERLSGDYEKLKRHPSLARDKRLSQELVGYSMKDLIVRKRCLGTLSKKRVKSESSRGSHPLKGLIASAEAALKGANVAAQKKSVQWDDLGNRIVAEDGENNAREKNYGEDVEAGEKNKEENNRKNRVADGEARRERCADVESSEDKGVLLRDGDKEGEVQQGNQGNKKNEDNSLSWGKGNPRKAERVYLILCDGMDAIVGDFHGVQNVREQDRLIKEVEAHNVATKKHGQSFKGLSIIDIRVGVFGGRFLYPFCNRTTDGVSLWILGMSAYGTLIPCSLILIHNTEMSLKRCQSCGVIMLLGIKECAYQFTHHLGSVDVARNSLLYDDLYNDENELRLTFLALLGVESDSV